MTYDWPPITLFYYITHSLCKDLDYPFMSIQIQCYSSPDPHIAFLSQYSTAEAHNLTYENSYDILFSVIANITILWEQKERVEQLLDKEENPSDSLVTLNVVLDLALNSSCDWVSYIQNEAFRWCSLVFAYISTHSCSLWEISAALLKRCAGWSCVLPHTKHLMI